jgi:hypothetical protein
VAWRSASARFRGQRSLQSLEPYYFRGAANRSSPEHSRSSIASRQCEGSRKDTWASRSARRRLIRIWDLPASAGRHLTGSGPSSSAGVRRHAGSIGARATSYGRLAATVFAIVARLHLLRAFWRLGPSRSPTRQFLCGRGDCLGRRWRSGMTWVNTWVNPGVNTWVNTWVNNTWVNASRTQTAKEVCIPTDLACCGSASKLCGAAAGAGSVASASHPVRA